MRRRAVLFDLGNTLVRYYDLAEFPAILPRCVERCQRELGVTHGAGLEALVERAGAWNRERGDYRVHPLAERLCEIFGLTRGDASLDRLCAAFLEPILALAVVDPSAVSVLRALRARGLRTGLVSNTPWGSPASAWRRELDRHGLTHVLDVCVFCTDVGFRKPHPAPFLHACEQLGIPPEQCAFVGDDPAWDVAGARAAGLSPVVLQRGEAPGGLDCPSISRLDELLQLDAAARGCIRADQRPA
jgi:putative hydrolase of the HAD superfamily